MRGASLTAGSLILVLLLTACADGQEPEITGTETETETETETGTETPEGPVRGGTLVMAIDSDPDQLNPAITTSGPVHTASELFYSGLVELDENGDPVPSLAEDWEIEDDGRTYRFRLRDDVVWHDGEAFTAEDVRFTFEEVLVEFHGRTAASVGQALEGIETPDEHTVVFRFEEPYAPLLQQLNVSEAPIIPEHVYGGTNVQENPANTEPVGTGPFRFASYEPGTEIRATRNEDYFEEGLPYLDEVVMRIIPEEATQVLALENGEVDFLWGVPGEELARLRSDADIELEEATSNPGGSNCIQSVSFNLDRPTFQDVRVRRAIALALDADAYVEQVEFGQGQVAEAPISSGIPWAHADGLDMPGHDPDEARRLLEDAGWVAQDGGTRVAQGVEGVDDGTEFTIDFLHYPFYTGYGELYREQLRQVGIDVGPRSLEPASLAPVVFEQDAFDTNMISFCNGPDPEIGVRRMYDSAQIGDAAFTNSSHYSNEEVDRLFEQASRTIDREERTELYRQIQEILVEELPYYWLLELVNTRGWTAECEGFAVHTGHAAKTAFCRR